MYYKLYDVFLPYYLSHNLRFLDPQLPLRVQTSVINWIVVTLSQYFEFIIWPIQLFISI